MALEKHISGGLSPYNGEYRAVLEGFDQDAIFELFEDSDLYCKVVR